MTTVILKDQPNYLEDYACATTQMLLAATALGYGGGSGLTVCSVTQANAHRCVIYSASPTTGDHRHRAHRAACRPGPQADQEAFCPTRKLESLWCRAVASGSSAADLSGYRISRMPERNDLV